MNFQILYQRFLNSINDKLSRFSCENIDDNLIRLEKEIKFILKIGLVFVHVVSLITLLKMELLE